MSLLASITSGVSTSGVRMVVAAVEKMGKTTFCSGAPGVLLVPCEVGFAGVNCPRTPMLQSWDAVLAFMAEVTQLAQQGKFPFKTIVFDSITAIERFIHEAVIARDPLSGRGGKKTITMDSAHGGYGKAYNLANDEFDTFLKSCDVLAVHAGINIVFTCHVFASKMVDPNSGEYDSWDLLLHSPKNMKTYGKREILTQWADVIAFMYEPIFVTKDGEMSKGVSQNKGRVMGLSRTPSYTAGNRFNASGEISIPPPPANGWNTFADAIFKASGVDLFTRQ